MSIQKKCPHTRIKFMQQLDSKRGTDEGESTSHIDRWVSATLS